MEAVLYALLEMIRVIAILVQPVIPDSGNKILDFLNVDQKMRDFKAIDPAYALKSGEDVKKPTPVFPRFEA